VGDGSSQVLNAVPVNVKYYFTFPIFRPGDRAPSESLRVIAGTSGLLQEIISERAFLARSRALTSDLCRRPPPFPLPLCGCVSGVMKFQRDTVIAYAVDNLAQAHANR
jgi:hypothetical protein